MRLFSKKYNHKSPERYKSIALYTMLLVSFSFGFSPVTYAVSSAQLQAWANGNNDYDTDIVCSTTSSVSVGNAPDSLDSKVLLPYIYTWLRGKGLTSIQAAAAVGNIAVESGGIPTRVQGAGTKTSNNPDDAGSLGWGLLQWTPGKRITGIAADAKVDLTTNPIYKMDTQLTIVLWHLKNTSPTGVNNMLKGFTQTDLKEATHYFDVNVEGPGHSLAPRYSAAKIAFENYESASNSALAASTSTSSSSDTTDTASTDTTDSSATDAATTLSDSGCTPTGVNPSANTSFISTVEKYVWPYEWRSGKGPGQVTLPDTSNPITPSSPTDKTPAYKAAIEKAKKTYFNKDGELSTKQSSMFSRSLYVGENGIDCGGFVTRLVQDSGLDKQYNMVDSKGRIYNGPTSTQAKYLADSGRWKAIKSSQPSSYYQPGDVAIQDGHTLIYVGEVSTFWLVRGGTNKGGGGTVVNPAKAGSASGLRKVLLASASQGLRAPMADKDETVGSSAYTWYRYVGSSSTTSTTETNL